MADRVTAQVETVFGDIGPVMPVGNVGRTERSEFFAPLMKRMREVLDLDPEAVW